MANSYKILLYHGVSNIKSNGIENYAIKHINKDKFYKQMQFIKENLNVLSINKLLDIISKKQINKNSV